jgi:transposase
VPTGTPFGMSSQIPAAVWAAVKPLLPVPPDKTRDSRWIADERVVAALFYQAKTGCQWRALPAEFPSIATVFRRRRLWIEAGVFDELIDASLASLPTEGYVDASFVEVDSRLPEKAWTKIGQGLKIQAICDPDGRPELVQLAPARDGEAGLAERFSELPKQLIGDSAYDTNWLRKHAAELGCRLVTNNNWPGRNRSLDHPSTRRAAKRRRWRIERCFAWLKAFLGVKLTGAHTLAAYTAAIAIASAATNLRGL